MQTILITGAGSGIGRATAVEFLRNGWAVGLLGRHADTLQETADIAGGDATGGGAMVLCADVTDAVALDQAIARFAGRYGRLDVLFNNAGVSLPPAMIDDVAIEDWQRLMSVNIGGMFLAARAAFARMRAQDPQGGRIINNGSVSAQVPRFGSAPYTMSKHAVTGLTKSLALDGRGFGITCGQIDIGNALTDMARPMTQGMPQADGALRSEPVMAVEDVARAVRQMAELPPDTNVLSMTIMAAAMPLVGRG